MLAAPKTEVVGYVFSQDAALKPGQIDPSRLTRINYAFANIVDGRMVVGNAKDAENYAYLTGLRKQNPRLRVLVSVGGWLWSTHFSEVALTPESRRVFIDSAVDFIKQYDLDGLDVDWEYPGMPGNSHPFRAEDKQNFTALLRKLRQRFDEERRPHHGRWLLTIAAGASQEYLAHTEMGEVQKVLDSVNLMTYDFADAAIQPKTSHNAPLYINPAAPRAVSADATVQAFLQAGVPAKKLYLGLPFYGRVWAEVDGKDHGLFQPAKPAAQSWAGYQFVTETMLGKGFARYWDETSQASYLYNAEKRLWVTIDDPEAIRAKCQYARAHKLGGVMFWEYNSDPSGALLKTVDEALRK